VVLKVMSTRHDGSAGALDAVLDVDDVLRTELVGAEDVGGVVDAEVCTELDEVEDADVCVELDEVEVAEVRTEPEEVEDVGGVVDVDSSTTVSMVVVYVVTCALTGTTEVSVVVHVIVTVSFVPVQSIGTYDVEVNVEA
jgi:Flp pilus assembly CpaF family ATPase